VKFILLCLLLLPSIAISQEPRLSASNTGDLVLVELEEAFRYGNKLIGGSVADLKNWPASFTTSQGNSRCTGTMLSNRVLQLAAHCVGNGRTATIKSSGKTYSSVCTHSPKYQGDSTADYALCYTSEPVSLPWYESVLTAETAKIKIGSELVLAGMGCTKAGGGGGNDNVFRVGTAPVVRLPQTSNDIVTKGSAALCFGDSGGSAFWKDEKGILRVAGVNSRGNIRDTSYLSAVYTNDGASFYKSWMEKNNAVICGLSNAVLGCRGEDAVPPPAPSPVPEWCKAVYDHVGQCIFGNPRDSLTNLELCRDDYAKLFACQEASELED
jgi:hypothetical protein